ncbi:alpha/beta fold hydrolase [Chitinophaga polysaccharea]|uniref:alpha/beta hydrolase n=1 Tax=Chitinophaga TaxID=79328 RepID=UPI00145594F0|nr:MULTISPECIES: alpha/beta fold hydrolase [Chitinophaga]NLR58480.1 alpha/beta fold hydrolase [Chitinophaga polysaccharea]NLU91008.1 alpha/beta fold hydrolase [Chitinophaga sp. Ak27]
MPRWLRISLIVIATLSVVYLLGPKPADPEYNHALPPVPAAGPALDNYIATKEARHLLKPDNQARIVWQDSGFHKTPYAVVYLHGFSASQEEGNPVHRNFAQKFGCNLYLSRLDGHGIDTSDPLLHMTAEGLWKDAEEALSIGKALGDKVILVGTSTGGTLALKLAAAYPRDVYAVINMSPNIAINDNLAFLANNPWGLQLARLVNKGDFRRGKDTNPEVAKYWYNTYRLEAVVQLESLLESSMTKETFENIHQPVLNLYYYKDEQHQDPTVKVSAILQMEEALGTPASLKEAIPVPNAGGHVMGCSLVAHDVPGVEKLISDFAINKLNLTPIH